MTGDIVSGYLLAARRGAPGIAPGWPAGGRSWKPAENDMKKLHASLGMLLGGLLVLTLGAQGVRATSEAPRVVVGTFDSRAVAIACIRSEASADYLRALQADVERALERARAAGDTALAADLEALGPAMQERMHQQGFGTAPVDDILARIADRLPALAQEAGVDVIVSKWGLAYRAPGASFVDVTERLAAAFEPDEATWKVLREVVETEPVPSHESQGDH